MEFNTETWEKFRVGDLFDVFCSKGYDAGKLDLKEKASLGYSYEFVGRTSDNYGVQGFSKSLDVAPNEGNAISVSQIGTIVAQYREREYYTSQNMFKLASKINLSKEQSLFFVAVLNKLFTKYSGYTDYPTLKGLKNEHILLPEKDGEPDWEFMTLYIREIKDKCIDKIEKLNDENIKKALEVAGLTEEDIEKELVVPVCDRYEEFKVGDLFDKRTIKGVPKYKEDLAEDKDGHHIFGQNIKYQYPQKILLDESYLQKIKRPIIAYSSSTAQINYINESFYRTGDNGAFQGLFPKFKNPEMPTLLYILTVLQKRFKYFGYATEMTNIVDLRLLLPAIDKNTPNFDFMETYIYIYIKVH